MSARAPLASAAVHRFTAGEPPLQVEAVVVVTGRDLTVTIGGGEAYHVGAVALAVPRPSLADPAQRSASTSVICVTGHKEDDLARTTAARLAAQFDRVVVVSAGIHLDRASPADIATMIRHANDVIDRICRTPELAWSSA